MPENHKNQPLIISTGSIFRFFLVAILFFVIYYLRDVVLVVLTSIVLASFVSIVSNRLVKRKFNRVFSVVLIYFVSIGIFAGLFYVFIPVLIDEVSSFSGLASDYLPKSNILNSLQGGTVADVKDVVLNISHNAALSNILTSIRSLVSGLSGGFLGTLGTAFGGFINLILIIVISFYFSIREGGIENFLRIIIPIQHEEYAIDLWRRTERKIALWVRGQLLLGLLVGVLTYLGLSILGVRYAFILAITAAIFELIPFGYTLASIPGIIFAYMDGGLTLALMVAGFYLIVHQFESYLLQPLVVKKVIGISPLVVILSLLIGFQLAGFWGVILAIPVAVVLLEFTDDLEKKKILNKLNA